MVDDWWMICTHTEIDRDIGRGREREMMMMRGRERVVYGFLMFFSLGSLHE